MATVVERTIGTGGDYATLADWFAACPADLVAVDQIWRGLVKNQEFVSSGTLVTIGGKTVSASCYVELTAEAGASFLDHADKATNPLRYDATKGASLKFTGNGQVGVQISQAYTRISKLQIISTADGTSSPALNVSTASATNCDINQCIVESSNGSTLGTLSLSGSGNVVRNSVIVQRKNDAAAVFGGLVNGSSAYNCTYVSLVAALTAGIKTQYVGPTLKNVYIGNVVAPLDGVAAATTTNCYSSATASGFTVAAFSTATFENVTDGTHDFRLASGSSLIDAGATDLTYSATDIIGTARPQGASYDVGAWEYAAAAAPTGTIAWTEADDTVAITGTVSTPASAAIAWTESDDVISITGTVTTPATAAIAWTETDDVVAVTGSVAAGGTITTPVLKNNTGTVLANETGVVLNVYNQTTGALVVRLTGLTSDASGIVTATDVAISAGTTYAYEVVLSANGRRLPLALAA